MLYDQLSSLAHAKYLCDRFCHTKTTLLQRKILPPDPFQIAQTGENGHGRRFSFSTSKRTSRWSALSSGCQHFQCNLAMAQTFEASRHKTTSNRRTQISLESDNYLHHNHQSRVEAR